MCKKKVDNWNIGIEKHSPSIKKNGNWINFNVRKNIKLLSIKTNEKVVND